MDDHGASLMLLWDVDGTLLDDGGLGRAALPGVFTGLTGRPMPPLPDIGGMVDVDIVWGLCDAADVERPPVAGVVAALDRAGAGWPGSLSAAHVLPGVVDAVRGIAAGGRVVQSVLTGNIRANADRKLAACGLLDLLDAEVGAYGSDDHRRWALVAIARERAERKYGRSFAGRATVLIGDTARDVDAAHRAGAAVIAVATGRTALAALVAEGPDLAVPDLTALGPVREVLERLATPV